VKINQNRFKNTSDFQGESGSATLNMENLSLFIDHMISNYNNAELATLREWVSNGYDSHVAAGQTAPVEVSLPTALNPTLAVRDYGLGMSAEDVKRIYLDFGSSTKRDDNTGIGGFGIGGKSALAIASQYTMEAVKDGLKNTFFFERSPRGGVDFKRVLKDIPTEEPNGVLVKVAVDRVDQFSEKNVNRVLAGWSNSQVKLTNGKKFFSIPDNSIRSEFSVNNGFKQKLDERGEAVFDESGDPVLEEDIRSMASYTLESGFDLSGERSSIRRAMDLSYREFAVLVGPVAYVFAVDGNDTYGIPSIQDAQDYIALAFNVGDVTFPSSREVIESTRANRELAGKVLSKAVEASTAILQKKVDEISSHQEALQIKRSPIARVASGVEINYKGQTIPDKFEGNGSDILFRYDINRRYGYGKPSKYTLSQEEKIQGRVFPLNIELLILDDSATTDKVLTASIARSYTRILHTIDEVDIADLNGYCLVAKNPTEWVRAAARKTVKFSELMAQVKEHRAELRKQGATTTAAAPKRTMKDKVGSYECRYYHFVADENGEEKFTSEIMNLTKFVDEHFDPSKKLILSTHNDGENIPQNYSDFINSYKAVPEEGGFLYIFTKAQEKTLRIVLGDEVEIRSFDDWLEKDFAKLAQTGPRSAKDILKELPVYVDRYSRDYYRQLPDIHPAILKIMDLCDELDSINRQTNSWGATSRRIRTLLELDEQKIESSTRPEFAMFGHVNSYAFRNMDEASKKAMAQTINFMVELWQSNVADEEALAEAEAEDEARAEAVNASGEMISNFN